MLDEGAVATFSKCQVAMSSFLTFFFTKIKVNLISSFVSIANGFVPPNTYTKTIGNLNLSD